jgi:predicted AlkP superfamily phosphohydrolase/phosphomutase
MTRKVIVIGLDGLEPSIVEPMLAAGELPNLARVRAAGGYGRVATTLPAQTPVAWSTFATGVNPGGHGIYDFIRRDPGTYLPDLSLNRYERRSAILPPKAVNLRRGTPVWELLCDAGIHAVVLRCPCTYPPDKVRGRLLSGMGVPDVRGGLGTATFYTTRQGVRAGESEQVIALTPGENGRYATYLPGPVQPRNGEPARFDLRLEPDTAAGTLVIRSAGEPNALSVREHEWSPWLRVKFKLGTLQSVRGMVRFHLVRLQPDLELYASPVNFDPKGPVFPISAPWEYAGELEAAVGTYYTTGMVEDHTGLNNGRFDEAAYLDQCDIALREREAMLLHELARTDEGLVFCLFDTPDRVQHMFWRFHEADQPANGEARDPELRHTIRRHYRRCDDVLGRVLEFCADDTLLIVLSDHGFGGFRRGVHLNAWLHQNGYLALRSGIEPGEAAGDLLRHVDWGRTRAYALGLGSIYLNRAGRERDGVVEGDDARRLAAEIAAGLTGLRDAERGSVAVLGATAREDAYTGPFLDEAPDLVVRCAPGYRASWATGLGGIPATVFEDNTRRWSGDHIIDPALASGVLFMNRPFRSGAHLADLAPTILDALGVPAGPLMEGASLIS